MATRFLYDQQRRLAVMYDSVSDTAFGPVVSHNEIEGREDHPLAIIQDFAEWCEENHDDPRSLSLDTLWIHWKTLEENKVQNGKW